MESTNRDNRNELEHMLMDGIRISKARVLGVRICAKIYVDAVHNYRVGSDFGGF